MAMARAYRAAQSGEEYPRRQIYNAKREERATFANDDRQNANDNTISRRQRPQREYTDYEPVNDQAYDTRPTTAERFRARASERTTRPQGIGSTTRRDERRAQEAPPAPPAPAAASVSAATYAAPPPPAQPERAWRRRAARRGAVAKTGFGTWAKGSVAFTATHRLATWWLGLILQPWAWLFYFSVQIPLAMFSLVVMVLGLTYHQAVSFVTDDTTWYGWVLDRTVGSAARTLADGVEWLIGFDLTSALDPLTLASALLLVVGMAGLFAIFLFLFVYWVAGYLIPNPRGGPAVAPVIGRQATALKFSAFVFAIASCFVPLLNLLPMIPLWTLVVWRFPR